MDAGVAPGRTAVLQVTRCVLPSCGQNTRCWSAARFLYCDLESENLK